MATRSISAPSGVTVTWNTSRSVEDAGTYTATLKGDGTKYSGTATVQLTVEKIDLAKDVITVGPVLAGKDAFSGAGGIGVLDQGQLCHERHDGHGQRRVPFA